MRKFANFTRLYFRIFQHFATKFWNFTTFKRFFQGISFLSSGLDKKLVYNANRPFVTETFTQRRSECKFYIHIIFFLSSANEIRFFVPKYYFIIVSFIIYHLKLYFGIKNGLSKTWTESMFYESRPCFSSPVQPMFYNMP